MKEPTTLYRGQHNTVIHNRFVMLLGYNMPKHQNVELAGCYVVADYKNDWQKRCYSTTGSPAQSGLYRINTFIEKLLSCILLQEFGTELQVAAVYTKTICCTTNRRQLIQKYFEQESFTNTKQLTNFKPIIWFGFTLIADKNKSSLHPSTD